MSYEQDLQKGKIHRGNFEANKGFLERNAELLESKNILEVGCGAGHLTDWLHRKGHDVIGIDISKDLIDYAGKNFGVARFDIMDAQSMEFPEGSFDVIVSFDLVEHLPDLDKHLQSVRKILKQDGCYLINTPNKLTNVPYEIVKNRSLTRHRGYHCSLQTCWSLRRLLQNHGFEPEFVRIDINTPFFKQKLVRTFGAFGHVLKHLPFHRLPLFVQTNFYAVARKVS